MHFLSAAAILQAISWYLVACDTEVEKAFIDNELVPKILVKAPKLYIEVNYTTVSINLGTSVTPLQTLTKPVITYDASDSDLYTLAFFGPDLPPSVLQTPPITQFLHALYVNIPGNNITKGDTIATYFPPTPYPGNLPYIFVVYKQTEQLNASAIPNMSFLLSRPQFNVTAFAEKYNLSGPVYGNFMREAYLALVPEVLKTVDGLGSEVLDAVIPQTN